MLNKTSQRQLELPINLQREEVFRRLRSADPNVLRLAMLQLTEDPELAAMRLERQDIRAGIMVADVLAEEHHDTVRWKAVDYLQRANEIPTPPSRERASELLQLFSIDPLSPAELLFSYEELALDEFPRDVTWNAKPSDKTLQNYNVVVIGCGISGIAVGIQLKRLGIPFVIYERSDDIGGTWFINDFPEARVDITSYLYQFKFVKNYPWSEYYASREETLDYLNHVVDTYGLRPFIRTRSEVVRSEWNDETGKWHVAVRGRNGDETRVQTAFLVSAAGLFSTANVPDIHGLDTFQGEVFHSTRWRKDVELDDRNVALIGNGSTGVQLMSSVARRAKRLAQFMRTPQWISPMELYKEKMDPDIRWVFDNVPYYWNWYCYSVFHSTSNMQWLTVYDRAWQDNGGLISERNDKLRQVLTDYIKKMVNHREDLYTKLIPDYAPMARRLVVDNGWYEALTRDNVELVTESVETVTPSGIRTVEGKERNFDVIILGTGFKVHKFLWPVNYVGRDGTTLDDLWRKDGPRSYLGVTLPKFPNFFMFYGPNSQPRGGGFYSWAEIWARYILTGIVHLIENGFKSAEVRQDVFDAYNHAMDESHKEMIRTTEGGKNNYYVNEFGRVDINVPWSSEAYHEMLRIFDHDSYAIR